MADTEIINFVAKANTKPLTDQLDKAAKIQAKHNKVALKGIAKQDKATKGLTSDLNKYDATQKKLFKTEDARMKLILSYAGKAEEFENMLITATEAEAALIRKSQEALKKKYEIAINGATDYMKEMLKIRDANEDLKKRDKEHQANQLKEIKQAHDLLTVRSAIADIHERKKSRDAEAVGDVAGFDSHKMTEGFADSFKDAMSSISSRDFGGLASSLGKVVGGGAKGVGGAVMRGGAGGGAGALGGMMAKMGPVLNSVAKMGPMIAMLSSSLMAVVKIFLDADAAAKDFNKEVLSTTSTSGFLAKNFGNAAAAGEEVKQTMADMYKQATSLDNLGWGISKETHSQVEAALGAQGVMLDKTKAYFDEIKAGRTQSAGMVKDWGSMVQMSVGYSRAFGVSLSEVTDLQGELMSDLGMGFNDVQEGFQNMVKGADDAGVHAGKFFNQIRGISSDLSLFNLRIGDAAKLMSKLDKSMSPKKAAQFFQTITGFFKGMGLMDRAKMVLMAGTGKTKDILQKDLAGKLDGLAADIDSKLGKGAAADIIHNGKIDTKKMTKFLAKNDGKLSGELRDELVSASRQQTKIQRGGIIDLASAMKDASPFAAMDEIEAMSKRMFGKPLEDLSGVQVAAIEQAANINDEQLDQFSKLKETLDVQKETIATKLDEGTALTSEEADMMKKLGITFKAGTKDTTAGDKLRHQDSKKVWDNMGKTQQDTLRDSAGTLDQAKRQGDLTQSITDKLGVIMDFLMGKLYELFGGVWDSILEVLEAMHIGDKDKHKLDRIQVKAIREGNKEVAEAASKAQSSGGGIEEFKKILFQGVGMKTEKGMFDLAKQMKDNRDNDADLTKKLAGAQTDDERKNIQDQIKANDKAQDDLVDKLRGVRDVLETQAKGGRDNTTRLAVTAAKAVKDAGLGQDMASSIAAIISGGGDQSDLAGAFDRMNVSVENQVKILEKMRLGLSPEQLAKATADANKALGIGDTVGGGPKAPGAPAAPAQPSAQQEASKPSDPVKQMEDVSKQAAQVTTTPTTASAAQAAAAPSSMKPLTPDDVKESTEEQGKNIANTMDDLRVAMKKQSSGIVLNGPYLKNQYGGQIEDSVYNAASKALFEYFMYSDLKREDVGEAIKNGFNPRDIGSALSAELRKPGADLTEAGRTSAVRNMKANAEGGVVTRPAPGEVFASVKPGERIVPGGGGGGGHITLELKGDLKRIIRAEAHNAITESQRAAPNR